jgi:hypothetical protein
MKIADISTKRLRKILRSTQAAGGQNSQSVELLRQELIRRLQAARRQRTERRLRRLLGKGGAR